MTGPEHPAVALAAVDDVVLKRLVEIATTQAAADEVTPKLTPGPAWSPERTAWLDAFHRDRRLGLDGPAGEGTWGVLLDGRVVGSVRLKRTQEQGIFETGVWLVRGARGRGVGTAALAAVLRQAGAEGATAVCADTASSNSAALGVLRRLGFHLIANDDQGVRALVTLDAGPSVADRR